jgi:3'-phosphoadenosine 5'-phosphosulfate sulfotransferase (PAPS reductase)/FAD synthetase
MSTALISIAGRSEEQLCLPFTSPLQAASVAITPDVSRMLAANCAVAIGVSGGKDSQACAIRTAKYLNEIGHAGPRVLIHADLGVIEWEDSLPSCERLAAYLGMELIVVRRKAGDMLTRWRQRWENNLVRYRNLSCVRLILPWSTPSMRFCTSELKVAPITSALKKRFPKSEIVNVSGIRRQESAARGRMPVAVVEPKLQRSNFAGVTWNPIIEWTLEQVFSEVRHASLRLHEAYTRYGSSRVSCAFCIMSSGRDLEAATICAKNQNVYRALVALEADSTFAFQGSRWLADLAPHLLEGKERRRIERAQTVAMRRQAIEAEIPDHLLYSKGWPTSMPTATESELIASVRRRVSELLNLNAKYLTGETVRDRYAALMEEKRIKDQKSASARRVK